VRDLLVQVVVVGVRMRRPWFACSVARRRRRSRSQTMTLPFMGSNCGITAGDREGHDERLRQRWRKGMTSDPFASSTIIP
jgi:hypothetical protein